MSESPSWRWMSDRSSCSTRRGPARRWSRAVAPRLFLDFAQVRVQKDVELVLIELLFVRHGGRLLDAIGVVEQHAEIADAPDASFGTHGGLADLDARVAEDALLRLSGPPVEVDLLVRAARDTHAPATALVLVDEHDTILLALVDGPRGTGGQARGIEAVLA